MKVFPHDYVVDAASDVAGPVTVSSQGLPTLLSASPKEFDGPGDRWSPETLLVAAAADCFILTFRAVARASKLEWQHLDCHAEGVLDRVERVTRFTKLTLFAKLTLPGGADPERGRQLLQKAETNCLISNSLRCEVSLVPKVEVAGPAT